MEIQNATTNDHEILTFITKTSKNIWGYGDEQIEKWSDVLTITTDYIEKNVLRKLVDDGRIIGYYALMQVDPKEMRLDYMFVLPEFTGKGLGKLLVEDAIDTARNLKYTKISLDADPNAEGFYERLGFSLVRRMESTIPGRFLPVMEMLLIC
ncbi:MAG: GNAT family N-acetyltransferase [Flavobacterium sp.]|uniref:GNAT family N-acetyltransferase n=1 Tax=Flavobacterium sp. TaxID=239 RepID=UPI00120EEFB4|nr:GNAT family N-acetyltransferase [Flavobacterium sp.]RZJ65729.1 MAG: GNAT family N-acetyltransferase [Flavobacterium sp.]